LILFQGLSVQLAVSLLCQILRKPMLHCRSSMPERLPTQARFSLRELPPVPPENAQFKIIN
jgi:hypothetical protein